MTSRLVLLLATLPLVIASDTLFAQSASRFEVTYTAAAHTGPLTGRLVLVVSKREQPEPRFTVSPQGPAVFGIDLDHLRTGQPAVIDDKALGYPPGLSALPSGEYFVQAVVNVYEQVRRADGHRIWVHMNDGTVEFFTNAAGNLYSDVQRVRIGDGGTITVAVTKVMPPAHPPTDTEWLKHVRIQSQKLTRF